MADENETGNGQKERVTSFFGLVTFGHQHPSREPSQYRAVTCTGNERGQENRHYYTILSRSNLAFTLVSAIQHARINPTFYSSDSSSCRMCVSGQPLRINLSLFYGSPSISRVSLASSFPSMPFHSVPPSRPYPL